MDLIDGGGPQNGFTGISEQDEWFERRQKNGRDPNRSSTNAGKQQYLSGNYETTNVSA